ncbi:Cytochrome b6 [Capsicum baccatum]|uniref:Cytochrome b6 n=1 Tax=Capsicum baccatum TaxID=33114 RepID=A0A2G2WYE1_CAPBA|nr:Cytochrome b6 [Capsicum baccatum]
MVEHEEIYHQYDEWNGNQKHDWGPHGLRSNLVNGAHEEMTLSEPYTEPRELTWVRGVVLAVLIASFSVTGYALPWDQIGYWPVKIVSGVPDAIPIIGLPLVELLHALAEAIVAAPAPIDFAPSNIST